MMSLRHLYAVHHAQNAAHVLLSEVIDLTLSTPL